MPSERIRLHIADVMLAVPAAAGVEAGMVVLTEDGPPSRSLRIIIGQPEARAIFSAWQGGIPGRPSTWDLFISTLAILGARLDCVDITAVQEERHYFANIELEQAGERRTLACRPSDALALAVRGYKTDIFAEESVLVDAGVMPDGTNARDAAAAVPGAVPVEDTPAGGDVESVLAAREAALAAREAELVARENALAAAAAAPPAAAAAAPAPAAPAPAAPAAPAVGPFATAGLPDAHPESGEPHPPTPATRKEIAAEALEVAAEAVAVAAEALEPGRPADPAQASLPAEPTEHPSESTAHRPDQ